MTQTAETTTERVDHLTRLYIRARLNVEAAERSLADVTTLLKDAMRMDRQRAVDIIVEDRHYKVAYRQRITYSFDIEGLRRKLPQGIWDSISKVETKISKTALEKALNKGEVDPRDIGEYITEGEPVTWVEMREANGDTEGGGGSATETGPASITGRPGDI